MISEDLSESFRMLQRRKRPVSDYHQGMRRQTACNLTTYDLAHTGKARKTRFVYAPLTVSPKQTATPKASKTQPRQILPHLMPTPKTSSHGKTDRAPPTGAISVCFRWEWYIIMFFTDV